MQAFYLGTRIFSGKEGLKEAMGDSQRIFLVTDSFLEQSKKKCIYHGNTGKGRKSLAGFFRGKT